MFVEDELLDRVEGGGFAALFDRAQAKPTITGKRIILSRRFMDLHSPIPIF